MILSMRRLSLLLGALSLTACLNTTGPSNDPSDPATETFASLLHVDISTMQKTQDGVYYRDVTAGTGPQLAAPQIVIATYNAYLKTGVLWDSGISKTVDLTQQVIGLQEGMIGMRVGGERLIVVPSALGFGDLIVGGIPPNSTLVFDIKLEELP